MDYVLLDEKGQLLSEPIAYRDNRTNNAMYEFEQFISKENIYQKTGIQFLNFNTLYQLFKESPKSLSNAKHLLFIPDYLGYVLTGRRVGEKSNVSSSQFLKFRHRNI